MTGWTALVPIKEGTDGKSRLASLLSVEKRAALLERMARHVVAQLQACPEIAHIAILSASSPQWWSGDLVVDQGRGLNRELTAWRETRRIEPTLIIHADLPLLASEDMSCLLSAAREGGAALATDRAGTGSNALALCDGRDIDFRFGPDSRRLHYEQWPDMPVLTRVGLAADVDTPDDLDFARALGFNLEAAEPQ